MPAFICKKENLIFDDFLLPQNTCHNQAVMFPLLYPKK